MRDGTREFFARLVAAGSVSSRDPKLDMSNRVAAGEIASMLEKTGFSVRLADVPGHDGKLNVFAHAGPSMPAEGLLLAGHSDTVPCDAGQWQHDPFCLTERDGRLAGLGSCDMKGFFAAICEALPLVKTAAFIKPLKIWATANEECGMDGAAACEGEESAAIALVGEPTDLIPGFAHKGMLAEKIVCSGRSGHASKPDSGASAIEGIRVIMNALARWRDGELASKRDPEFDPPCETLSFGIVGGGDAHNRICERCELTIDHRLLPGSSADLARKKIRAIAAGAVADIDGVSISFAQPLEGCEALDSSTDSAAIRLAVWATGREPIALPYATEAPHYAAMGMSTVIMGAGSIDQAHRPNEHVEIAQIDHMAEMLAKMIHKICSPN